MGGISTLCLETQTGQPGQDIQVGQDMSAEMAGVGTASQAGETEAAVQETASLPWWLIIVAAAVLAGAGLWLYRDRIKAKRRKR